MRAAVRSPGRAEHGARRCQDAAGGKSELVEFLVVGGRAVLTLPPGPGKVERVQDRAGVELGPGARVYFRCPRCWRRVQDLYLCDSHFWCRRCHGLAYASQQESRPRWLRRAQQAATVERRTPRQRPAEPDRDWEQLAQEAARRLEKETRRAARERRLRYVEHTGRPGRPREKRRYRRDGSRRAKLKPDEAYCCRCRAPRRYRYPRRADLVCSLDAEKGVEIERTAIRARCRVCNGQVFRIVRPAQAEGLQQFHPGLGRR